MVYKREAALEEGGAGLYQAVINAVAHSGKPDKFNTLKKEVDRMYDRSGRSSKVDKRDQCSNNPRQQKKPDKFEWRRSDMGHFVFSLEKGEVPLTNRDLPTPGPAEYSPDYTKCSVYAKAPEYSSRLWTKPLEEKMKTPGPKYHTAKGFMKKKHAQVSQKGRNRPPDTGFGGIGPGPASYRVLSDSVGTQQRLTKTTLKGRTGARAGLGFGILEVPCESQGFVNAEELVMIDKTNKCVAIGDAPKWSFGGAREDDSYTTSGPGPAAYDRPADYHNQPVLGKSITGRNYMTSEKHGEGPGPGEYLTDLIDKPRNPNAVAIPRRQLHTGGGGPAPNEYTIRGQYDNAKKCFDMRGPNITFRDHTDPEKEAFPGPCEYQRVRDVQVPGGVFSESGKTKFTYPDCLNYKAYQKSSEAVPGAAAYNPTNHCIGKNCNPKHSFGKMKSKSQKKETAGEAGPGNYNIRNLTSKGVTAAPKYSLGSAPTQPQSNRNRIPAPSEYSYTLPSSGHAYTMQGRYDKPNKCARKANRATKIPGPHYDLRDLTYKGNQTSCKSGVTIKSRPSPHIYPGIDTSTKLKAKCLTRKWNDDIYLN